MGQAVYDYIFWPAEDQAGGRMSLSNLRSLWFLDYNIFSAGFGGYRGH